jgi:hypothetical protein
MDLTLTLTGANGDTITFDYDTYILTDGLKGFGIPPTKVRIQESATDGGVFRHSKRGIRDIDLPIVTVGTDRADTETKLRRLARILQNSNGAARLTATYDSGDVYFLDLYYTGGGETVFGDDAGSTYARWVVALQAPKPYWTSQVAQTFSVVQGAAGRGLLPQLTKLKLTSSQAIGVVTVNNTNGDVPSYPIWQVYGPLDSLTVSSAGSSFTYNAPVAAGQSLVIDTAAGTVVDGAGVNKYSNLGAAPKLFTIPPGTSSVSVSGVGSTTATVISCTFYPRREVLH